MRAGKVKITNELIAKALNFPSDWIIESIQPCTQFYDIHSTVSEMVIIGSAFPEVPAGQEPPECRILIQEKQRIVTVEPV